MRRSLRLLTLLTLMASALCTGQTLAAQDVAAPDAVAVAAPAMTPQAIAGSRLVLAGHVAPPQSAFEAQAPGTFAARPRAAAAAARADISAARLNAAISAASARAAISAARPSAAAASVSSVMPSAVRLAMAASATAPHLMVRAAVPLLRHHFSPLAERAPPTL